MINSKFILVVILFGLFCWIIGPFVVPIILGALLANVFFKPYDKLRKWKFPPWAASLLISFAIAILLLLPASLMAYWAAAKGIQFLSGLDVLKAGSHMNQEGTRNLMEEVTKAPWFQHVIEALSRWFPIDVNELMNVLQDIAKRVGMGIAGFLGGVLSSLPSIFIGITIMVVSIFFCFLDGRRLVNWLRKKSPFTKIQTEKLLDRLELMSRSVILATVITALAQSTLFFLACLIVGIDNLWLIYMSLLVCSFLPLVGSAPLTFGIALIHLFTSSVGEGIFLLIMAVAVASVDNIIRPWVLKGAGDLHPLLAFLAAFGGLKTLGPAGIFVGPIVVAMLIAAVDVFYPNHSEA